MFSKTIGAGVFGLNGVLLTVEVDIANGIPALDIVGLPDASVRESKERVKAAIRNSGYDFPCQRITVNLAPADLKKFLLVLNQLAVQLYSFSLKTIDNGRQNL